MVYNDYILRMWRNKMSKNFKVVYECKCGKIFRTVEALDLHYQNHHTVPFINFVEKPTPDIGDFIRQKEESKEN